MEVGRNYWIPQAAGVTTSKVVTINPGVTLRLVDPKVYQFPPSITWNTWFVIHDSLHWTYTAFNHNWQGTYGDFTGETPEEAAYWSDLVNFHAGDISGKAPVPAPGAYWDMMNEYSERYMAANGIANIADVSLIGAHWQKTIPPNLGNVEYPAGSYDIGINDGSGNSKRADINADNIINIGDVSVIGANWQKTWTDTPPAWPTTGP